MSCFKNKNKQENTFKGKKCNIMKCIQIKWDYSRSNKHYDEKVLRQDNGQYVIKASVESKEENIQFWISDYLSKLLGYIYDMPDNVAILDVDTHP